MGNSIDMGGLKEIARPLLPMFFVLDTSGSMEGQPISMLNHAMEEVLNILGDFSSSNPDTLIKVGVMQFSSGVSWVQPKGLEELEDFYYSPLTAGGLTEMGAALTELDKKLSRHEFIVSTTGYCEPIIIFMTDGRPTDTWEDALKKIRETNTWFRFAIKIGFAVGPDADANVLSQIVGSSEAVIQTKDLVTFSKLLQKVALNSAMIGSKSHLPGEGAQGKDIVKLTIGGSDIPEVKPEPISPDPGDKGGDEWPDDEDDWN